MLRRITFAIGIFCLLIAAPIYAQTGLGTLSGYVVSADGGRISNARVYLQPGNGRAPHTMLTDKQGHYTFTKIRPGLYDVRAHANDAWSEEHRNVVVKANKEMNVDLKITTPAKPKSDLSQHRTPTPSTPPRRSLGGREQASSS